jgi:putative Holliday junction resolvase
MNGTEGHRVQMVEDFIVHFDREFHHLEIKKTDERLTTRMARSIMIETNASRKKQKANKDNVAAVLILETYLSHEKNQ